MRMALLPPLLVALTTFSWPAQAADAIQALSKASATTFDVQHTVALSLSRALEMALANHPELAAAQSEVEAANAARLQAGVRPNPIVEAEVEDTRRETRSTTLLLTQPIELGGKRAARMNVADRTREIASSQLEVQRAELRARVNTTFFDALAAQERVKLAQASFGLAERATEVVSKRVTAGKVSPVEQIKAQVAQAGVRIELQQAQGDLRSALRALSAAIASPRSIEEVTPDAVELPDVASDEVLEQRLATAPLLRQARLEADRLGAVARLERAKRLPDMTVGVGAKRSEELGRSQTIVALSIPLPVFDNNRGAELEALRRQDKARHEADAAVLRLRTEVSRAHERLRVSRAEAEALQAEVLPGAQTAFEAASKGFELGKFAFLDVLDAQRTLIQARTQRLRAVAEAHRAAAEIDRLLGTHAPSAGPSEAPPMRTP